MSLQENITSNDPVHLIVAHDDPADRAMLERVLEVDRTTVIEWRSDRAGLMALLDETDADCVIIDRMLGQHSSLAIHDDIKGRYPFPPAMIMLAPGGDDRLVLKTFRCGFDDFVDRNTVNTVELVNAVARAVERRRMAQHRRSEIDLLARLAHRDPLTGLPNRAFAEERLALLTASGRRHRKNIAVLKIRLDGLRAVNDRFGHTIGDSLLRAFSARLKLVSRASDTFGRYGGGQFLYLIDTDVSPQSAEMACRRLVDALSFPVELDQVGLSLTASIGAAIYPIDGRAAADLLAEADRAMDLATNTAERYVLASHARRDDPRGPAAADLDGQETAPIRDVGAPVVVAMAGVSPGPDNGPDRGIAAAATVGEPADAPADPPAAKINAHRESNRRTEQRHRVLKQGIIILNNGRSTIACIIRDLSPGGAGVTVEAEYLAEPLCSLHIVETGERFAAERRWQRGRDVGLKFLR